MKKLFLGVALFSTLALAGCSTSETIASSTAGQISQEDFYEELKSNYGAGTLQTMLTYDVLEERYSEQVTQEDIDAVVAADTETLGGEEAFTSYLEYQGITTEEYEESAALYLYMVEAVKEYSGYTEEDLKAYYEEWQPANTVSHILVEDEATANEVIERLNNGDDWNTLVSEYSTDTASVPNNGQLSYTPGAGELVEQFETAANELENGEISDPVETTYGYHIIRMDEKATKGTFEEERENVEQLYVNELMADSTLTAEAIATVASEANIVVEDDDLQGVVANMLAPIAPAEEETSSGESTESESSEETSAEGESSEETSSEEETSAEETSAEETSAEETSSEE